MCQKENQTTYRARHETINGLHACLSLSHVISGSQCQDHDNR